MERWTLEALEANEGKTLATKYPGRTAKVKRHGKRAWDITLGMAPYGKVVLQNTSTTDACRRLDEVGAKAEGGRP